MNDPATVTDLIHTRLRVVTWNLWWQFGPWEQRLPLIIDELRAVDPDVIALQEVWVSDDTTSAGTIADALGFHHELTAGEEVDGGIRLANAIVSRWPITGY